MCNYFSTVITKNTRRHKPDSKARHVTKGQFTAWYRMDTNSHEEIIQATNLQESTSIEKLNSCFVRLEITPKDNKNVTRNLTDWVLRVDQEEKQVPEWYVEEKQKAEAAAWLAWAESVAVQLVLTGEHKNVKDCFTLGYGDAVIVGSGNCTIRGYDNCTIRGYDNCTIRGYDNCTIIGSGNCTIDIYGQPGKITLNSTTATLQYNGEIYVHEKASVHKLKNGVFKPVEADQA